MPSAKKILRKLIAARDEQTQVMIVRSPKYADTYFGFVVELGKEWVLFARTADGGVFDGHFAARIEDVIAVRKDTTYESRMSRLLPEWPPSRPVPSVDLDSLTGVLTSLGANDALISIEKERERSARWIGTVHSLTKKWVWLLQINSDATWHERTLGYRLKAITLVARGGRYIDGLQTISNLDKSEKATPDPT
jgi:hypothetical protein